jgi:hypothetical protein
VTDGVFCATGNQFIFQYFRGILHAEREALLVREETSFLEVGEQLGDECNDIVRPITNALCRDLYGTIEWTTTFDPNHFIIAACILKEIIDDEVSILTNVEIPFSESMGPVSQLFSLSSNFTPTDQHFGIVDNKILWSVEGVSNPIFATLCEFIRRRDIQAPNSSFAQILQCCETDLDQIPPTNPFKKYAA